MKKEEQNMEENTKEMEEEEKQKEYQFFTMMSYSQFIEYAQDYVRKTEQIFTDFNSQINNEQKVLKELRLSGCFEKIMLQEEKIKKIKEEELSLYLQVEKVIESYDSIIEEHKQREKRNKN